MTRSRGAGRPAAAAGPTLRLRSPSDILAAVPYLFGFHPADSLVVLGLRGRRLIFQARADLPRAATPESELRLAAARLADVVSEQGAGDVIIVGYGGLAATVPALRTVVAAMRCRGLTPVEVLRAADGRYWSTDCAAACCPPEGTPYDVSTSVVAARATLAGCVALPDREAVVRTLAPPAGPALVAIQQAGERAATRVRARCPAAAAVADLPLALARDGRSAVRAGLARYAGGGRLDDDEVAWLSTLLALCRPVRDWAWERLDAEPGDLEPHQRLWSDVVRRCDPALVPAPAVLLAYAFWRTGDGIRAAVAVDRALNADPGYSAAVLIDEVLRRAIPPEAANPLSRRRRPARVRRRERRRSTR